LFDGSFYLLQSRPVTGVEFSWDADVEECQTLPDDPDTVWTRKLADDVMTGIMSPLHFSIRFGGIYPDLEWPAVSRMLGLEKTARKRPFKYRKGQLYYNAEIERDWIVQGTPPVLRPNRVSWVPETWRDDILNAPFSWLDYVKMLARLQFVDDRFRWDGLIRHLEDWRTNRDSDSRGLYFPELEKLSDRDLIRYIERQIAFETEFDVIAVHGLIYWYQEFHNLLGLLVERWYDGANPNAYVDLLSGTDVKTDTQVDNERLSTLVEAIRHSQPLRETFEAHEGRAFFEALEDHEAGREFLQRYQEFVWQVGHRGMADRDLYYDRREEDPALDYRNFKMLLAAEPIDHHAQHEATNARRHAMFDEVLANIRSKPFGPIKAEIFKVVYDIAHRFIIARDNERAIQDKHNISQKRAFRVMGRRMVERGQLDAEMDLLYLTKQELYPWFEGNTKRERLLRAKIAARKRDILRFDRREIEHPMHLQGDVVVELSTELEGIEGVLVGRGNSPGTRTGTARVVKSLNAIGTVKHGEILIAHATDPGWTPVFSLIKGVVVETGGMLAHACCLAREYGIPAVTLPRATTLIPDGATIEVDGSTGHIKILDEQSPSTTADEAGLETAPA
jgi:pyruvate,water dikinase